MIKLYITPGSPYARMARIVALEEGMEQRVEIIAAQPRVADSPYYGINPSGRVPYLIRDDGVGLEESAVICAYLDHLDGSPAFDPPAGAEGLEARRLEGLARSMSTVSRSGAASWRGPKASVQPPSSSTKATALGEWPTCGRRRSTIR